MIRTMKNIILSLSLLLTACGGGDSDNNQSPIVGSWSRTIEGTGCIVTINFDEKNGLYQTSLDEVLTGTYSISDESNNDLYSLSMNVSTDNGLSDCNGESFDDTGEIMTVYVNFSGEFMRIFEAQDTTSPAMTLIKN